MTARIQDGVMYHSEGLMRRQTWCFVKQDCPASTYDDLFQDRFNLGRTHIQYIPLSKLSSSNQVGLDSGTSQVDHDKAHKDPRRELSMATRHRPLGLCTAAVNPPV